MPLLTRRGRGKDRVRATPAVSREERDAQQAIIEVADKSDGKDRDLVHGDGRTIDLPVKPGNVSKDD